MIEATQRHEQDQAPAPLLVTIREVARLLGVCERTVYLLTKGGQIPSIRIGRAVRYDPDDLRAYIAQQAHRASIPADHGPSLAPRSGPAPDDGPIRLDDLFAAWTQWCEQHGHPIITSKQTFGLNLAAIVAGLYRRREAADVPFDDGIAPKGDKP